MSRAVLCLHAAPATVSYSLCQPQTYTVHTHIEHFTAGLQSPCRPLRWRRSIDQRKVHQPDRLRLGQLVSRPLPYRPGRQQLCFLRWSRLCQPPPVLAEGPVFAIKVSDQVLNKMDDWNTKQHGQSGLVDRVRRSTMTLAEAEAEGAHAQ